jgi:hypothetical protein
MRNTYHPYQNMQQYLQGFREKLLAAATCDALIFCHVVVVDATSISWLE